MSKSVFVLLAGGVEEMEAIAPIDLLRRAGAEVTILSTEASPSVVGRNNINLVADALLDDYVESLADMIVIPGGPSHLKMKEDLRVIQLIQAHDKAGRQIASICAGPIVLGAAGVLKGKQYTSHFTTEEALPERRADQAVVCDGSLITSQGAGTATQFALRLVEALFGEEKASEIETSISGRY